jgi:hypothetical protein
VQHHQLDVLRRRRARQQHHPPRFPDEYQRLQAYGHEPAMLLDQRPARTYTRRVAGMSTDRAARNCTPERARARAVGRRHGAWLRHHRLDRGPAGVRAGRLDPRRLAGQVHRGGGPQPCPAPGGHRQAAERPVWPGARSVWAGLSRRWACPTRSPLRRCAAR